MPWKPTSKRKPSRNENRPNFRERGYSTDWTKASVSFRRLNPLCVECEKKGIVAAATCVDHIVPHRGDLGLFWDTDNWQSLCETCHARKSASERMS